MGADISVGGVGVTGYTPLVAGVGEIMATVSSAEACAMPAARTKKSEVAFFILMY